jgi:hypothetical protein
MKQYAKISVADVSEVVDINKAQKVCTMRHSDAFGSFHTEVST